MDQSTGRGWRGIHNHLKRLGSRLSVKGKLVLCIILVSIAPQCLLALRFFNSSKDTLVTTTQRDIYQLVQVNNELLDQQLKTVREATMNILVDKELYKIFSDSSFGGLVDRSAVEKSIHSVLTKYFGSLACVRQVDIITRPYTYSMNTRVAQYRDFFAGEQYRRLTQRDGGIVWLGKSEMADYQHSQTYLSCARLLNLVYVETSGIGTPLPEEYERAAIRVQFSDEFFMDRLEKNVASLDDGSYWLVSSGGETLVSGGGADEIPISRDEMDRIWAQGSGIIGFTGANGARMVACFDKLSQSGWMSLAVFSADALANALTAKLYNLFLGLIAVLAATSILAAALAASLVAGRIRGLDQGMAALKAGDFTTQIIDERRDEFSPLVDSFNRMSRTLRQLIDENYKARLSEQEARIQTLMMQFNPHFLYNTLNVINWRALSGGDKKTSAMIVSLSRILRYTCDVQQEQTRFADDLEWIKQYLSLMEARFQGLFTVEWAVDSACMDLRLPKLFLQPLLENCVLHGFSDRRSGGVIQIRMRLEDGDALCEVEDNGVGMSDEQARRALSGRGGSLGLYNTHQRIMLKCGDGYGFAIHEARGGGCLVRARMRADTAPEEDRRASA
ncbi:MAG: histidine kinase [Oscillospiraceae bacterium]|jgi:two-component system sensor histidine kinase YesM|nr:histidine kinase [Oscillospiraceae bacterium]